MLPELDLDLDIPELDIDLSAIEGFEIPDLPELLLQTEIDGFNFDLTGIDEDIAEFVAGVDDLDLNFPEDELTVLEETGETHEL